MSADKKETGEQNAHTHTCKTQTHRDPHIIWKRLIEREQMNGEKERERVNRSVENCVCDSLSAGNTTTVQIYVNGYKMNITG